MASLLRPQTLPSPSMSLHYGGRSKKIRKQKLLKQKQNRGNLNGFLLSFPKSYPTPILINQEPPAQTKLQALESVANDVQSCREKGVYVEPQIFSSLLETCYELNAIELGIRIHRLIPSSLLSKNVGISSKLVRLYASFGCMDDAHQLFDQMPNRDASAFPWNSLVAGYAELGMYEDAMAIYFQMAEDGVKPDQFTFPRVLKACGGIGLIGIGEAVHRDLVRLGFGNDGFVQNALVDMYAKCGDIVKARRIFDKIASKDSISWNSMLTGYVRHGLLNEALNILSLMFRDGVEPDSVAMSAILGNAPSLNVFGASEKASSSDFGLKIHGWIVRRGMEWDISIANSLIAMYANGGKLDQALWLFHHMPERDTVSWNSIIAAHCKCIEVLTYFEWMERDGFLPDKITFVSILSACAHLGLVNDGERLFLLMIEKYKIEPITEHYACMVNLYGRAGMINEAYSIIADEMDYEAGPTAWGALLYACYLHGNVEFGEIAAQSLFELEPDNEHNFELLMKIYGSTGRLEDVQRVRTMMIDRGL